MIFRCELCGFEDDKELRQGVNNHWRKGYVWGIRPRSQDAFCYGWTKEVKEAKEATPKLENSTT